MKRNNNPSHSIQSKMVLFLFYRHSFATIHHTFHHSCHCMVCCTDTGRLEESPHRYHHNDTHLHSAIRNIWKKRLNITSTRLKYKPWWFRITYTTAKIDRHIHVTCYRKSIENSSSGRKVINANSVSCYRIDAHCPRSAANLIRIARTFLIAFIWPRPFKTIFGLISAVALKKFSIIILRSFM